MVEQILLKARNNKGHFIKGHKINVGRTASEETIKRMSKPRKSNLSWIGKKLSNETRKKIGLTKIGNKYNVGRKHSIEYKKIHSEIAKKDGRKPPSQIGLKRSPETIEKIKLAISGEKSPMWKGGYKVLRKRGTPEEKQWRKQVFNRDNYTCTNCGVRNFKGNGKTIELNAHHIKSWVDYEELRFDIDNGITLCLECHKKTETYGRPKRNNKRHCFPCHGPSADIVDVEAQDAHGVGPDNGI